MAVEAIFNFLIAYILAFFRLGGLMIAAPVFGSTRVPKRVKLLFALVATIAMGNVLPPVADLTPNLATLIFAVGNELVFGLAMGTIVSFTFIAAQWAGEMIGQQIGFNLSEVFDPQYGQAGSLVGDIYFMLTLIVFLSIGGHRMLIDAVHTSFTTVPLLSLRFDREMFDTFIELFTTATTLAMRLAAPMFFTMLVVDLAMGCIGKAMPQFNIMSAGVPIRNLLGLGVLVFGLSVSTDTISDSIRNDLNVVVDYFGRPRPANG